ncbi:MAG TPA: adenylate/guanylate cyclase domain-containing protein [Oligoflexus sp.]|uniref:adenylate/guanylate cyclase domain-containing protein n=1 Tax=Oligoflexus sp. TaxID=1971216 RepID=UPI002D807E91|nr:adenylate/guanylate cyclase domain-containing protein [Oligoflexus sp.]HET9241059.1 adenylate/guanylate cyclase domain-containing protein [Oligoflexus sp.]
MTLLILLSSALSFASQLSESPARPPLQISPLLLDDPGQAVALNRKKLESMESAKVPHEFMRAAFELQSGLIQLGRYEEALVFLDSSLPVAQAQHDREAEAWFRLQRYQAESSSTMQYTAGGYAELEAVQKMAQDIKNPILLGNVHLQKAYFHTKTNQEEAAAKSFHEAYKVVQSSPDELQRLRLLGSLAIVYTVNSSVRLDRALEMFEELHQYFLKHPYRYLGSVTYFYYGDALSQMQQWDKALDAYQRSYGFAVKIQDEIGEVYARLNIAKVKNQQRKFREALGILHEILPTFARYRDEGGMLEVDLNRVRALLSLGRKDEAQKLMQKISPAMERLVSPTDTVDFHRLHSEVQAAQGDYEKAYQQLEMAYSQQLKIFDERKQNIAQRYYIDFEIEKSADRNRLLQQENELQSLALSSKERQTQLILAILVLALGVLIMTGWLFYKTKRKNAEIRSLHQYIETNVLQRFLPPVLVAEIIEGRSRLDQKAKSELVTILFADLCEFTQSTERLGTATISHILNDFFVAMTDVVFEHGGTIDKFIGDCVMVIFGAPLHLDPEEQARRAVACAFAMHQRLKTLNASWELTEHEHFEMRIGIHQGSAVVGSFGGPKRADYTVIGQAVNLASRVEALATPRSVFVTEAITPYLPRTAYRSHGFFRIRGLNEERELFEVLNTAATEEATVA